MLLQPVAGSCTVLFGVFYRTCRRRKLEGIVSLLGIIMLAFPLSLICNLTMLQANVSTILLTVLSVRNRWQNTLMVGARYYIIRDDMALGGERISVRPDEMHNHCAIFAPGGTYQQSDQTAGTFRSDSWYVPSRAKIPGSTMVVHFIASSIPIGEALT